MRSLLPFSMLASACTAQLDTTSGPTFGGDQRAREALTVLDADDPEAITEAGVLAAWPVAVGRFACASGPCLDTRSTWMPGGDLLVAIALDAVVERDPVDLAFALDASGSMSGVEDARSAAVEVALDHLDDEDVLAVWAFTGTVEELVPAAPVTDSHRAQVRLALRALDGLPLLRGMVARPGACEGTFDDLFDGVVDTADTGDTGWDTGDTGWDTGDTGGIGWGATGGGWPDGGEVVALRELVRTSQHTELGDMLLNLACEDGSAIGDAVAPVLDSLPDGSGDAPSRMVLVTDLGGPSALDAVVEAANRFVGTSLLRVSEVGDVEEALAIAEVAGAHTLEAPTLAEALVTWDARFDALVDPLAWDVDVALADSSSSQWSLERVAGTTDADATGANAWFASEGHGVLGAILEPTASDPEPPVLRLTFTTPEGAHVVRVPARLPVRLIRTRWGEGDDEVALAVAWRLALVAALQDGDADAVERLLDERRPEIGP